MSRFQMRFGSSNVAPGTPNLSEGSTVLASCPSNRRFAVSRHRKRRAPHIDRDTHNPFVHDRQPSQPRDTAEVDAGALLRQAREAKGLSLDDLARTTKINRSILAALEEYDLNRLPAPIYTRGFVKAYAREVGLDPEGTANQYWSQAELAMAPAATLSHAAQPSTRPERVERVVDHDNARILMSGQQPRRLGGLVTVACAIGLVLYVWSFNRQQPKTTPSGNETQATAVDATRATAPAEDRPDAIAAARSGIELAGPLEVELRPAGLCWIVATADGTQVLSRLLRDGERQTISVNDELTLRIGDPGALSYSINGRSGRPLGRAGEAVNVRITRENFRDFIAES